MATGSRERLLAGLSERGVHRWSTCPNVSWCALRPGHFSQASPRVVLEAGWEIVQPGKAFFWRPQRTRQQAPARLDPADGAPIGIWTSEMSVVPYRRKDDGAGRCLRGHALSVPPEARTGPADPYFHRATLMLQEPQSELGETPTHRDYCSDTRRSIRSDRWATDYVEVLMRKKRWSRSRRLRVLGPPGAAAPRFGATRTAFDNLLMKRFEGGFAPPL